MSEKEDPEKKKIPPLSQVAAVEPSEPSEPPTAAGRPAAPPGVLSAMESDMMIKARARRTGGAASRPGAQASRGGNQAGKRGGGRQVSSANVSLTSSTTTPAPPPAAAAAAASVPPSAARMMEEDALAKARARGGGTAARPGAAPSTMDPAARKQKAAAGRSTRGVATPRQGGPLTKSMDATDVVASATVSSANTATASFATQNDPGASKLSGAQALADIRDLETDIRQKDDEGGPSQAVTPVDDGNQEGTGDAGAEGGQTGEGGDAQVEPAEAEVYAGLNYDPSMVAGGADGGIMAELAEPEYVDAAAVGVIKPDEEIEAELKAKQKKMCYIGICVAFVLILIVVIPTAILVPEGETRIVDVNLPSAMPSAMPSPAPSMEPTSQCFARVVTFLENGISDVAAFDDPTSPQFRAAEWISEDQQCSVPFTDVKFLQRYALATFFYALGGENWIRCRAGSGDEKDCPDGGVDWLSPDDECTWGYLRCSDGINVDRMNVSPDNSGQGIGNNMIGSFPPEMTLLTGLDFMVMSFNEFSGLEELARMTTLRYLVMSQCEFNGTFPVELFVNNPLLETMRVSSNHFEGGIPSEIGALPSLIDLSLHTNNFNGTIPTELGNADQLGVLFLSGNDLSGTIPTELFNIANLRRLELQDNPRLTGEVPSEIGQLALFRELNLGSTEVGGALPSEFFQLGALQELYLDNCGFSGSLDDFVAFNATLINLVLSGNSFAGSMPAAFDQMVELIELRLDNNQLTGALPDLSPLSLWLQYIALNGNMFSGPVPDGFSSLIRLAELTLHDNLLTGSISEELCRLRSASLEVLTTDCAEVNCTCCDASDCFYSPTAMPTMTSAPVDPTLPPTQSPSSMPSVRPSARPSSGPSTIPTGTPSSTPSGMPTSMPSMSSSMTTASAQPSESQTAV